MKFVRSIKDLIAWLLLGLAVIVLAVSLSLPHNPGDTQSAAKKVSAAIGHRMNMLNGYVSKALNQDPYQWIDLQGLPDDMVVYRYCSDTLQSWCNQFSLINDDISNKVVFQRLTSASFNPSSPLAEVGDTVSFVNFGPKWYLVKSASVEDCRVIGGLEIMDTQDSHSYNGVNHHLRLGAKYSINPLAFEEGSPVYVDGVPQFKVFYESLSGSAAADPPLMWLSLILFFAAGIVFLTGKKTVRRLMIYVTGCIVVGLALFFWGYSAQNMISLFSPIIYAGGTVLYSLGAVIIINMVIMMVSLGIYLARHELFERIKSRKLLWFTLVQTIVAVGLIILYTHLALSSIIDNSGISLELFKLAELSWFTGLVYFSFIAMLLSAPLLLKILEPVLEELFGWHYDSLSRFNRVVFAVLTAAYLLGITSVHGFEKEESRLEVMSNRLAIDRDIALELRLKRVENQIAEDMIISSLSAFDNTATSIQNRISDTYFYRISQNYYLSVLVLNPGNTDARSEAFFNSRVQDGVPIAENSHFFYVNTGNGPSYYAGVFMYYVEGSGYSRVLLMVEGKTARDNKGYEFILGTTPPGRVIVPSGYSYARYDRRDMQYYNGKYDYPTRMSDKLYRQIYEDGVTSISADGYRHFVNTVTNTEAVIISRPAYSLFNYLVAGILLGIAAFVILSLATIGQRDRTEVFARNYYKTRISGVLMTSLILTLVVMATVSVLFVYHRNESHLRTIMTDKLNSISSMLDVGSRAAFDSRGLLSPEMRSLHESVCASTNSDITIFSSSGRMLLSSTQRLYGRMLLDSRIDGEAFNNIIYNHRRYFIHKEKLGDKKYYGMYAPLFGARGDVIGILCTPYADDTYSFEEDAVQHSMAIVAVFLLLLLLARFMTNEVLGRLFRPLSVLGRKINDTNLDSLELIEYNRDDEVQSLVSAYNRMVTELSDNSRKLAQAERDKAWSGMARQVAHEIKNPLTPMKLQLQRVIRLKQKDDPAWVERFDEASKVLLDHIDILTDTANEFSTFAKLYSEEHTEIDLDLLLQEEIAMFDNRDDIGFEYLGLAGSVVKGPKPQLTRVFVNLLSNAVQALDEKGGGHVVVQLRKAREDGFYEIVVEDDGPGVSEENVSKLFTPNFTTKNSGSGLGLAISRSILERCGATISYSRSFSLGGACFTVRYPK